MSEEECSVCRAESVVGMAANICNIESNNDESCELVIEDFLAGNKTIKQVITDIEVKIKDAGQKEILDELKLMASKWNIIDKNFVEIEAEEK